LGLRLFALRLWKPMSTLTEQPSPSAALEVPGEDGVYFCARHKSVHTRLRCGRCEAPICPKCTVMTPVGARCRDCGTNRSSHIFQVGPAQLALAFGVSLLLGAVGAWIARWPIIGFLTLLYAPASGTAIGKAVTRVTKGKRGLPLALATVAGLAAGALLFTLITGSSLVNPWVWIFIALASIGAWWWIR
jgi:hypothetical protein